MNERTEKLYKEAVELASAELHEWNKNWQPGKHTNFEYEKVLYKKFAELIVRECAKISIGDDPSFLEASALEDGARRMLKHFGVEE